MTNISIYENMTYIRIVHYYYKQTWSIRRDGEEESEDLERHRDKISKKTKTYYFFIFAKTCVL